jgi:alpha-galactosidase
MPIESDGPGSQWHLFNGRISVVLCVLENGWLGQLHLGAPLPPGVSYRHLGPRPFHGFSNRVGEPVALEVPTRNSGDFRIPALDVESPDGSRVLDLRYVDHDIEAGKPDIPGLPSTYVEHEDEAQTLSIRLRDELTGLLVTTRTTLFAERPVIARSIVLENTGSAPVVIRTAMSASIDLPDAHWDLTSLSGTWARERHLERGRLLPGRRSVGSVRGGSGHEHNPFLLLTRPATTEADGEALGVSLVYTGSFLAETEVEPLGSTRIRIGIHPESFAWLLQPGATFATPEAVIAWSGDGIGGVSDALHGLYRSRLARGAWRDRPRPVLLNSWEGVYFGFDEPTLVEMAKATADLGIELFVLDDGWFGRRDDDHSSLGDWTVDRRKLPNGIDGLARAVEALGIRFGLWIEPEMVNEDSDLFRAHPDWAVGIPGRPRTESRYQLVLDLSRPEVVDHLVEVLTDLLGSAPISYVKWDFNRFVTEPYSTALPPERQGEFKHRFALGLYELWRRVTAAFPDILFESCSGGGGRFDPGLLAFAPQVWTSDDTDAIERLAIQWGTSIPYPLSTMAAHTSAIPNHQVGRTPSLATRSAVAFFGVFGYELDPRKLTDAERAEVREQVAYYAARRDLFQFGRFVRLRSPFEADGNETAWAVVSDDRRRAIVGHYRVLSRPVPKRDRLVLRGLDPEATYRITVWPDGGDVSVTRSGTELMHVGLPIDPSDPFPGRPNHDFTARLFDLEALGD